jgi:ATP-binding cassette subfamily B multidrug efflux pump
MKSLSALLKYFKRYKTKMILGFLFIFISNISQIYIPIFLKDAIDSIKTNFEYSTLNTYALLIIAASIVSGVFRFFIRQTIIVVSREIEYDLRQDFWGHIQKLSLRYFQNNSTGNIMSHATNDINAVRMFVGPAVMYFIDTAFRFIVILIIILSISPLLTIYSLLPLPILSYLVYWVSKKIYKKFVLIQEKFSDITTKAQETFNGIRVIKSYVREENENLEFKKLNYEYLDRNMDKVRIQALFQPILYMITGISVIIVTWLGGIMVIQDKLTIGELSAYIVFLGMLIWPTIAFGWVMNIAQQAAASMQRLLKITNEVIEIKDYDETHYNINEIKGNIEFENVSFKYGNSLPYVLRNINIKIEAGQTVAFVGNTGEGKTSLINLIPRLYDTTEGKVKIDGFDVKQIPIKVIRRNIGLVPQETFLFSDTLENNILFGVKSKKAGIMQNAASIASLIKDVEQFPEGFNTVLGEKGITLSGGQKQRTALARAIATDPKILILDDSFSAVDTNTEDEILAKLKDFMKGRTSIIISHRISTVKNADKIFVINKGKIAEEGTHDELVELGGIYAEMNEKQLLEKELKELN